MSKKKIIVYAALGSVIILLVAGSSSWWIWKYNQIKEVNCLQISSIKGIEKCLGKKIEAIGMLDCRKEGVPLKAGVHWLKFPDGSELRFLEGYPDCQVYDKKTVKVIGEYYQCKVSDQCTGTGLHNVESITAIIQ